MEKFPRRRGKFQKYGKALCYFTIIHLSSEKKPASISTYGLCKDAAGKKKKENSKNLEVHARDHMGWKSCCLPQHTLCEVFPPLHRVWGWLKRPTPCRETALHLLDKQGTKEWCGCCSCRELCSSQRKKGFKINFFPHTCTWNVCSKR